MTQNRWNTPSNRISQDQLYRRSAPISSLLQAFIAWPLPFPAKTAIFSLLGYRAEW
jgi:hypothetical protein